MIFKNCKILSIYAIACGKENQRTLRIVGGAEVNPAHRYPWMAAIVTTKNSPFCGGVLINN
jgi:hypothetical protein